MGPQMGFPQGRHAPVFLETGTEGKTRRQIRLCVGGNSCSLLSPLMYGDPGGDGERRLSARSRLGCLAQRIFSARFIIKFICVELRQGGV